MAEKPTITIRPAIIKVSPEFEQTIKNIQEQLKIKYDLNISKIEITRKLARVPKELGVDFVNGFVLTKKKNK